MTRREMTVTGRGDEPSERNIARLVGVRKDGSESPWAKHGPVAANVWRYIGKRYLDDPYYLVNAQWGDRPEKVERFRDLIRQRGIPEEERILLAFTFDSVVVRSEEVPRIIEYWDNFSERTGLGEKAPHLAEVLKQAASDDDLVALRLGKTTFEAMLEIGAGVRGDGEISLFEMPGLLDPDLDDIEGET